MAKHAMHNRKSKKLLQPCQTLTAKEPPTIHFHTYLHHRVEENHAKGRSPKQRQWLRTPPQSTQAATAPHSRNEDYWGTKCIWFCWGALNYMLLQVALGRLPGSIYLTCLPASSLTVENNNWQEQKPSPNKLIGARLKKKKKKKIVSDGRFYCQQGQLWAVFLVCTDCPAHGSNLSVNILKTRLCHSMNRREIKISLIIVNNIACFSVTA